MNSSFTKIAVAALVVASVIAPLAASAQNNPNLQARIRDQHARVREGANSGRLTPGQATTLRARDTRLEADIARDKARHGGHLTTGEHARLERHLNHTSGAIYREKH